MGGRKAEYGMQVGLECPLVSVNAVDEKNGGRIFTVGNGILYG
jgi:hypothetical protein